MIIVYFTSKGYFITGNGVEISRRCSPALTHEGDPIFQNLHHTYKVLYLALKEIMGQGVQEDVTVYGDSRIVDEMNGQCPPLDDVHQKWVNVIHQYVVPAIRGIVLFRKKSPQQISAAVESAHSSMLEVVDRHTLETIAKKERERHGAELEKRKKRLVSNLRKAWFGENYER